jgi:hypothetical protein
MAELSLIFGSAVIVFLMWQLYDRIDEEKHEILKLLVMFFNITFMLFIPLFMMSLDVETIVYKLYLLFYKLFWTYVISVIVVGVLRATGMMLPKESKK